MSRRKQSRPQHVDDDPSLLATTLATTSEADQFDLSPGMNGEHHHHQRTSEFPEGSSSEATNIENQQHSDSKNGGMSIKLTKKLATVTLKLADYFQLCITFYLI